MTNYERIKNMSIEEMAQFINRTEAAPCSSCNYTGHACGNGSKQEICISEIIKYVESEVK